MPILKQSDAAPLLNDPTVVLDLGDLQRQADRIIAAAEQEAERILEAARAAARDEGVRIRAEAEAAGRVDGETAGRATGEERGRAEAMAAAEASLDRLQEAWIGALQEWSARRTADLAAAREDVVALGVAIAERIVHGTVEGDRAAAARQAAAALELLSDAREVRVLVHPEDEAVVAEAMPRLAGAVGGAAHVSLGTDASVDRGGVVVRSGEGTVDARIETQLRRIAAALVPGRAAALDAAAAADAAGAMSAVDVAGAASVTGSAEDVGEGAAAGVDAAAGADADGSAGERPRGADDPNRTNAANDMGDANDANAAADAADAHDADDAADAPGTAARDRDEHDDETMGAAA